MKIFVLLSRIPYPLEKGDKLRAYHQLKHLAKENEIFLCCLSDKVVDEKAVEHLREFVQHVEVIKLNFAIVLWQLFLGLFSRLPYQVHYFYQRQAAKKINRMINRFAPDHIYCQLIRTTEYVKNLHHFPKTLDYMDALNAGLLRRIPTAKWWMRGFVREEAKRLVSYEHLIFDYFDHHSIISKQDQQFIYHPDREKIAIIPNGVDTDFFAPIDTEKKYDLVFTGNMNYPPNIEGAKRLALEILPLIQKEIPNARVLIAGADPSEEVKALASSSVHISGWMNDIRDAYFSSRIFVAPMVIGSGMQNKLLEAMSMTLPCVTTPLAAIPLEAVHQQELWISETNEEIADACIFLLKNNMEATALGLRGRTFVTQKFNWRNTVLQLNQLMNPK
jgi:sugar transferase (PEP-CTERM/EpsH1 system associated)